MLSMLVADEGAENALLIDRRDGVSVVTIAMPALRERQAQLVGNRLLEIAHHAKGRLIVRLDAVASFCSAFINELIKLSGHCNGLGGRLVVVGVNAEALKAIRATGLDRRFTIADSEPAAWKAHGMGGSSGFARFLDRFLFGVTEAPQPGRHAA